MFSNVWFCSIVSGATSQQPSAMIANASINEEVSGPQQQGFNSYALAEESVALSMASGDLHQHHIQQEVDCREERINASAPSSSMGIPQQMLNQSASLVYTDHDNSYSVAKDVSAKRFMSEQTNVCKVCLVCVGNAWLLRCLFVIPPILIEHRLIIKFFWLLA